MTLDTQGHGLIMERSLSRRRPGPWFAALSDWFSRTFPRPERPDVLRPAAGYETPAGYEPGGAHAPVPAYAVPPVARFPITRQGYDCDSVDAHVADLERELAELEHRLAQAETQVPSRSGVAIEIERIGEQTSAILVAAHDEAQQTVRLAQSQADTVIADAASYAAALTEEAQVKVRRLEAQTASLSDRRERLIDEIRSAARALTSLADEAAGGRPPAARSGLPPTKN